MKRTAIVAVIVTAAMMFGGCQAIEIPPEQQQRLLERLSSQDGAAASDALSKAIITRDPVDIADATAKVGDLMSGVVPPASYLASDEGVRDMVAAITKTKAAEDDDTVGNSAEAAAGWLMVIGKFLGPPWGSLATILAGVGMVISRVDRNRQARKKEAAEKAAVAVAKAIEEVKKPDGTVNFKEQDTRDKLSAKMGAEGKAIVNIAQGKAPRKAA